jgi:hypothetical protein
VRNYYLSLKALRISRLAFPDDDYAPSLCTKCAKRLLIALHISCELLFPEDKIRFRRVGKPAACVPMPETPMHEYRSARTGKDDVRAPWQT